MFEPVFRARMEKRDVGAEAAREVRARMEYKNVSFIVNECYKTIEVNDLSGWVETYICLQGNDLI